MADQEESCARRIVRYFHAAHRIRHVVIDLGWRHQTAPLSLLCYGGAIAGAATAAWLILTLPAVAQ